MLLGATRPDRIGLEKALKRWTELSWFLDEVEVETAEAGPDGAKELPKAWRLGNRPNLRQMHHDAFSHRVPPELVEAQLIDFVEKLKSLTQGASAAGAKVPQPAGEAERRSGRRRIPLRGVGAEGGIRLGKAER